MVGLAVLFDRVEAGPPPVDSQLILFIGPQPHEVFHMESFIRLRSWTGPNGNIAAVVDVLIMPTGEPICLGPECGPGPCRHVEALRLHGLLPRAPRPRPEPEPRPIVRPTTNGKAVALEGRPCA